MYIHIFIFWNKQNINLIGIVKYEGLFEKGKYCGDHVHVYHIHNTLCFEGKMVNGRKEGLGILYWPNEELRYSGEFRKDLFYAENDAELFYHNKKIEYKGQ